MTDNRATKKKIKEAIIVEGRDDTAAVKKSSGGGNCRNSRIRYAGDYVGSNR